MPETRAPSRIKGLVEDIIGSRHPSYLCDAVVRQRWSPIKYKYLCDRGQALKSVREESAQVRERAITLGRVRQAAHHTCTG